MEKGMAIPISRPEVLSNLQEYRKAFSSSWKSHQDGNCRALVHRQTGKIKVARKIHEIRDSLGHEGLLSNPNDWQEISILYQKESLQVLDENGKPFSFKSLSRFAWRIVTETLTVLQWLRDKGDKIKDETDFSLYPQGELPENCHGWMGEISREKAEELLASKQKGTYLMREADPMTLSCAFHLSQRHEIFIFPYILSVREEGKIAEKVFFETDRGWTFYEDEPDLKGPEYRFHPSVSQLLRSSSDLQQPLSP
jgi:hypothetical protein